MGLPVAGTTCTGPALTAELAAGLGIDAHAADAKVRAAVERQFEIIGEALDQLA